MACCCNSYYVVQSIDKTLGITLTNTPNNLQNEDIIKFCIPKSITIPDNATATVTININGTFVSVMDRFGNPMTGDELKKGILFCGYYGTEGLPHVQIINIPRKRCNN